MNERIQELAFEANKNLDGNVPIGFAEKFAELIVQECIQHINEENVRLCEYQNSLEPWETSMQYECDLVIQKCIDLVEGLKEHFGVEDTPLV